MTDSKRRPCSKCESENSSLRIVAESGLMRVVCEDCGHTPQFYSHSMARAERYWKEDYEESVRMKKARELALAAQKAGR